MQIPEDELKRIFPPEKTDAFFDALYGGAEEGAYDISLVCKEADEQKAVFFFELRQRPGKCLKCSLTYGLPEVFRRHPVIDLRGIVDQCAAALGWPAAEWTLGPVEEVSPELHRIPLVMSVA